MKKKYLFLALCTFLYISTGTAQEAKSKPATATNEATATTDTPTEDEELVSHKVAMGETIMMIARKYKIKPKDIYEFNPDATEGIAANMYLEIPVGRGLKKKQAPEKNITHPDGPLYTTGTTATADVPQD